MGLLPPGWQTASRHGLWVIATAVALLASAGTWFWYRARVSGLEERLALSAPESELPFVSPYRNARLDVGYVGDAVCAGCHPGEAETYRQHPMGRSLEPLSATAPGQSLHRATAEPFGEPGVRYHVETRDGHIFHEEVRSDTQGTVLARTTEEVQYIIGSGTRSFSYLIEHEGFLFQSPITRFSQKRIWDLSPGFEGRTERFERPVGPECLSCHTNDAAYRPHLPNAYRSPPFRGYAIGCERCHGPGQLHADARARGEVVDGIDYDIVNARHLPPALRDAVCQQCHLEGEIRVLRRGREPFDFRPGLPLEQFWSVFVRPHETTDRLVGSFEQLYASRCFQASAGRLGCISCHDPHLRPDPATKAAYFRDRCLACHHREDCTQPATGARENRLGAPADNCIACHMPRLNSSDIPHLAISDHRIPRTPGKASHGMPELPGPSHTGSLPLVLFPQRPVPPGDLDANRDLEVALTNLATLAPDPAKRFCLVALPQLEKAVKTWPEDLPAREALAFALSLDGHHHEALAICQATLARVPDRAASLELAARLTQYLGDPGTALADWRRLVELNPWTSRYRIELAKLLAEQRRWLEVLDECQTVLHRSPANVPAHLLLAAAHAGRREQAQARAAWQRALALDPQRREPLWRWFAGRGL
jgi:hypothetical protein